MHSLTLIGVGLIGGSLALDLKRLGWAHTVIGIDIQADNLARALERKVIDQAHTALDTEALQSDIIVIATPVASMAAIAAQIADRLPEHTVITDVGSTKQSTLGIFARHLPRHYAQCVAAHPIAGSDRHGALAAQFGLFEHKKLVLCPHAGQDSGSLNLIEQMWQTVGADIYRMDAAEHDGIFAAVSHLPHLLAYAFVNQIAEHPQSTYYLDFAASGFRDFTRIAASHPDIWADVSLANRDSLLTLLAEQQQQLARLQQYIHDHDHDALRHYFSQAKAVRDDWQNRQA